jgi:hypothetical protein
MIGFLTLCPFLGRIEKANDFKAHGEQLKTIRATRPIGILNKINYFFISVSSAPFYGHD